MSTGERDEAFERLLEFIRDERGFDFTGYKRPSLRRRIAKRMDALRIAGFDDYFERLTGDPDEFAALFDTICINVTGFFRDAPAWDFLREEVIPEITSARGRADSVRVWSTGCATGEEAYSAAILLAEALGDEEFKDRVKLYATDVDDAALVVGRHATYGAKELAAVPEDVRERYFDRLDGRYRFRADLRRSVIFGRHDLIHDPPISRIDLLLSRNTLMYFEAETQRRILANFHFALKDEGYLFLGKSEVLAARTSLFAPVDLKKRVFAKIPRARPRDGFAQLVDPRAPLRPERARDDSPLAERAFDTFPMPALLLDAEDRLALTNHQARSLFGLLAADHGRPLRDLDISYQPVELRSPIAEAREAGHGVAVRDVRLEAPDGSSRRFDVHVAPLHTTRGDVAGIQVTFADTTRLSKLADDLAESRREAETASEELQSTVEELETTNEELQSTNEELETTNEELQSTNEELETMNEELQSTNEELETMNDELRQRTDEASQVNLYLETILRGLRAGVVVLDGDLRVEVWNAKAADLWGLRADEAVGQHLMNLDIGLPVDELHRSLRSSLAGEEPPEVVLDATNRRGRAIRCRVTCSPMRGADARVQGVIVLMEDEREPVAP